MAKIILICGKICTGKTTYARRLAAEQAAVILSTDEVTYDLIRNQQGEFYNVFADRVNGYLRKKAAEIVRAGANVILDWGFWTREGRREISEYFTLQGVDFEWHALQVEERLWQERIARRNALVQAGEGEWNFYVDEGLLHKCRTLFQMPERDEMDLWVEEKNL